jgi:hypothetical protein
MGLPEIDEQEQKHDLRFEMVEDVEQQYHCAE